MSRPLEVMEDEQEQTGDIAISSMPEPTGWQILVKPYKAETVSKGGIVLSDSTSNANKHMNVVGQVMKMGELCYNHERFSVGGSRAPKAWCKPLDWVLYGLNMGTKFTMYDTENNPVELLLLNDDHIKAIIDDPTVVRAYI